VSENAPSVSFVIPAYNAATTLEATLASVVAQTVSDWEAVIVDDGSNDQTAAVAFNRAKTDPRLRLVRQANAGASAARNRGLIEARGGLVTFLDSDDWIAPEFLSMLMPLSDQGRAVAYCAYRRILPSGRQSPVDWCPELASDPFGVLAQRCEPAIHCMLIPRWVLNDVGGFDTSLQTCEDWDLWLRIARTGVPFRGTSTALASYQMRPFSLSTTRALGDDASRVLAVARKADPRVGNPAPLYAQGDPRAPERLIGSNIALQCARVDKGYLPDPDWIRSALGPDWEQIVCSEPGDVMGILEAAAAGTLRPTQVCTNLIDSVKRSDRWTGDLLSDWQQMGRAEMGAQDQFGLSGRWLAFRVDGRRLPTQISAPHGCDALLLISSDGNRCTRRVALPLTGTMARERLAQAVLDMWSLSELTRIMRAWRSPRFLAALTTEALAVAAWHGLRRRHGAPWRWMAATAVRRAMIRFLGAPPNPPLHANSAGAQVAVLMFDKVVPGVAGVLDQFIGIEQVAQLLALLAAERFETVGLSDLQAARRGSGVLPARPLILVFGDPASTLDTDVLKVLPSQMTKVEFLFEPDQIATGLPAQVTRSMLGLTVGAGLRARRMPHACEAAVAAVTAWRIQLAEQMDGVVPVGAFTDMEGLAPQLLQDAGFELVLALGSGHVRVDLPSPIVPVLECCGSGAIGDVLENLRPAA
jgi:hypothetical protein